MSDAEQVENKPTVETVTTASDKDEQKAQPDVLSDPALADQVGTDWTDEGGATPAGPATKNEHD